MKLLTLDDVNAIQDEAHKTYRQHQRGGIGGQMLTMYDMWDYHVIMATLNHYDPMSGQWMPLPAPPNSAIR